MKNAAAGFSRWRHSTPSWPRLCLSHGRHTSYSRGWQPTDSTVASAAVPPLPPSPATKKKSGCVDNLFF